MAEVDTSKFLRAQFDQGTQILTLAIDRQDNDKNQINTGMAMALRDTLYSELMEPRARGVIIKSGKPKLFSTGADIDGELKDLDADAAARFSRIGRDVFGMLEALPCVTVACLHGFTLGGGLELALCCDFRIAAKTTRMGLPEINLGLLPGWGGSQRLPRLVGTARARAMIYSGDPVKAELALEYGLIDEVVDKPEMLQEAAEKLLAKYAAKSRTAIAYAKRAINEGRSLVLGPALELECDLFGLAWAAPDRAEGIAAYLEKRKPQWGK